MFLGIVDVSQVNLLLIIDCIPLSVKNQYFVDPIFHEYNTIYFIQNLIDICAPTRIIKNLTFLFLTMKS